MTATNLKIIFIGHMKLIFKLGIVMLNSTKLETQTRDAWTLLAVLLSEPMKLYHVEKNKT